MRKNQGYLVFVLANNSIDTIFVMVLVVSPTAGKHETSGPMRLANRAISTCEIHLHSRSPIDLQLQLRPAASFLNHH